MFWFELTSPFSPWSAASNSALWSVVEGVCRQQSIFVWFMTITTFAVFHVIPFTSVPDIFNNNVLVSAFMRVAPAGCSKDVVADIALCLDPLIRMLAIEALVSICLVSWLSRFFSCVVSDHTSEVVARAIRKVETMTEILCFFTVTVCCWTLWMRKSLFTLWCNLLYALLLRRQQTFSKWLSKVVIQWRRIGLP